MTGIGSFFVVMTIMPIQKGRIMCMSAHWWRRILLSQRSPTYRRNGKLNVTVQNALGSELSGVPDGDGLCLRNIRS